MSIPDADDLWQPLKLPDGRRYFVINQGFGLVLAFKDTDENVDFEIEDGAYYTEPGDFDPKTFDFSSL